MRIKSTPHSAAIFTLSANIETASSNGKSPNGSRSLPVGPISNAIYFSSLLTSKEVIIPFP